MLNNNQNIKKVMPLNKVLVGTYIYNLSCQNCGIERKEVIFNAFSNLTHCGLQKDFDY